MTLLDYEKAACDGREMPDGLSYPDQILFLELRTLYAQHRAGVIDKDTAIREKKKLLETYKQHQFVEAMGKEWVEVIKVTELARAAYRKDRTLENADKLILILEGRKVQGIGG